MFPYPGLEFGDFFVRESIRLGNHRDQIDFGVKPAHELNVNLLQAVEFVSLWNVGIK